MTVRRSRSISKSATIPRAAGRPRGSGHRRRAELQSPRRAADEHRVEREASVRGAVAQVRQAGPTSSARPHWPRAKPPVAMRAERPRSVPSVNVRRASDDAADDDGSIRARADADREGHRARAVIRIARIVALQAVAATDARTRRRRPRALPGHAHTCTRNAARRERNPERIFASCAGARALAVYEREARGGYAGRQGRACADEGTNAGSFPQAATLGTRCAHGSAHGVASWRPVGAWRPRRGRRGASGHARSALARSSWSAAATASARRHDDERPIVVVRGPAIAPVRST